MLSQFVEPTFGSPGQCIKIVKISHKNHNTVVAFHLQCILVSCKCMNRLEMRIALLCDLTNAAKNNVVFTNLIHININVPNGCSFVVSQFSSLLEQPLAEVNEQRAKKQLLYYKKKLLTRAVALTRFLSLSSTFEVNICTQTPFHHSWFSNSLVEIYGRATSTDYCSRFSFTKHRASQLRTLPAHKKSTIIVGVTVE